MLPNISLPTKAQWIKVLWAIGYAFVSTFLGIFMLAGGIQDTWEATTILLASSTVAGVNAAIYTLKITFFDKPIK